MRLLHRLAAGGEGLDDSEDFVSLAVGIYGPAVDYDGRPGLVAEVCEHRPLHDPPSGETILGVGIDGFDLSGLDQVA